MKKILHIVKEKAVLSKVLGFVDGQKKDSAPSLLLIQEAAQHPPPDFPETFILSDGKNTEPDSPGHPGGITYEEMLERVFSADSVIVW